MCGYIMSLHRLFLLQKIIHNLSAVREKFVCHRAYEESADNGADTDGASKEKTDRDEAAVDNDADRPKGPGQLVADDDSYQVIWPGTGI